MTRDHDLVRMANDIAANLAVYPEPEAIAGVVKHISDFWAPRMRSRFQVLVEAGGIGLSPLALAAGRRIVEGN